MIGKKIREYRKGQNYTQEQLAQRLGVSAGAVSKWETENSLPDTELLIPLARELHVTLDELFDYRLELSDKEITAITEEVRCLFQNTPFSQALEKIEDYSKKYPRSEKLLHEMAKLIWKYSTLSPFKTEEEIQARLTLAYSKFQKLFDSTNQELALDARYYGAVILMSEGNYEALEPLLETIPAIRYDTFFMKLNLLESQERFIEAKDVAVNRLFTLVNELLALTTITGRLYKKQHNNQQTKIYQQLLEQLEVLFQPLLPKAKQQQLNQLISEERQEAAAIKFEELVREYVAQPLSWENHFIFHTIKLAANDKDLLQSRRILLTQLLDEYQSLSDFEGYQTAKQLIDNYGENENT